MSNNPLDPRSGGRAPPQGGAWDHFLFPNAVLSQQMAAMAQPMPTQHSEEQAPVPDLSNDFGAMRASMESALDYNMMAPNGSSLMWMTDRQDARGFPLQNAYLTAPAAQQTSTDDGTNTVQHPEFTPDQLQALAAAVTRLMASNAEPEADPVPSADAPDAHMERMSTAVKEHVHLHVCVALGAEYVGRGYRPRDIPDSPTSLAEVEADGPITIFWELSFRTPHNKASVVSLRKLVVDNWEANAELAEIQVFSNDVVEGLVMTYLSTLRSYKRAELSDDGAVRLAAHRMVARRTRRRRQQVQRYKRGLALLRERHGGEGLKGAEELADIGYFDSEVSEIDEDGEADIDDDAAPTARQLFVIKREWVAREVRRFIYYVVKLATGPNGVALTRNRTAGITNSSMPRFAKKHLIQVPRISHLNPRWTQRNTYRHAIQDDPSHTFLSFEIPNNAFADEEEEFFADDEDELDADE